MAPATEYWPLPHLCTVLLEVVDCACSLTNARYGALSVFDASGEVRDLITFGILPAARKKMGPMPTGRGLIGYLNEVQGPLRLADLSKHPRSVGLPDFLPPMKTFLGTPIRHAGRAVGNIYLTEKDGRREGIHRGRRGVHGHVCVIGGDCYLERPELRR